MLTLFYIGMSIVLMVLKTNDYKVHSCKIEGQHSSIKLNTAGIIKDL